MTIAGSLTLDNAIITGTGNVIDIGANTYTLIGSGDTDNVVKVGGVYKAKIKIPGIVDGSRVYVRNVTSSVDLDSSVVSGGSGYILRVNVTTPYPINYWITKRDKVRIKNSTVVGTSGISLLDTQINDIVQQTFAIAQGTDMSGSTEFATDYVNIQADVNDSDNITNTDRLYLWIKVIEETDLGIRNLFGCLTADDTTNIKIDRAVTTFSVQNQKAQTLVWGGARLYTSDGSSWIGTGTGSIEPQFGKVYSASGVGASLAQIEASTVLAKKSEVPADVWSHASATGLFNLIKLLFSKP